MSKSTITTTETASIVPGTPLVEQARLLCDAIMKCAEASEALGGHEQIITDLSVDPEEVSCWGGQVSVGLSATLTTRLT